ncbi:hypothetical protein GJ496_009937 [Pomphorhynchus laevis]|nr:hypothetical protein GJ496_009937 [Pomphorhynchus laevis]
MDTDSQFIRARDFYDEANQIIQTDHVNLPIKSRLFAVIAIGGHQFKVTSGDLVNIRHTFAPTAGQEIAIKKVLLVAGPRFTIVGRPLVSANIVSVRALVIEKTLSNVNIAYWYKQRSHYEQMNLDQIEHTVLKIKDITVKPQKHAFSDE